MSKIFAGRFAAQMEGSFVVFIIGMRVNRLLAIHKWPCVVEANKHESIMKGEPAVASYDNPQP